MKKTFNALRSLPARAYAAGTMLMLPVLASAQSVDPFDTALATISTKVTSYGGALVGLAAIGVVFVVAIKYVKRIPKAS